MNTDSKSISRLYDLFSSTRRRLLWQYMMETDDETVPFEELVEHLLLHESDEDSEFDDHRTAISVGLHHTDLPKLDDFGLIEYDAPDKTIRRMDSSMGTLGETLIRTNR